MRATTGDLLVAPGARRQTEGRRTRLGRRTRMVLHRLALPQFSSTTLRASSSPDPSKSSSLYHYLPYPRALEGMCEHGYLGQRTPQPAVRDLGGGRAASPPAQA
jgi:hypothetical protein